MKVHPDSITIEASQDLGPRFGLPSEDSVSNLVRRAGRRRQKSPQCIKTLQMSNSTST